MDLRRRRAIAGVLAMWLVAGACSGQDTGVTSTEPAVAATDIDSAPPSAPPTSTTTTTLPPPIGPPADPSPELEEIRRTCSFDGPNFPSLVPLDALLASPEAWVQVSVADLDPPVPVDAALVAPGKTVDGGFVDRGDLAGALVLRGDAPERIYLKDLVELMLAAEVEEGADTILAGFTHWWGRSWAFPVMAIYPDGSAFFVGDCAHWTNEAIESNAERTADYGSPADLLIGLIVGDPAAIAAYERPRPKPIPTPRKSWIERDPLWRNLHAKNAPADLIERLHEVSIIFDFPAAWETSRRQLCTRDVLGWNKCGRVARGSGMRLAAYASPGQDLIVILRDQGTRTGDAVIGIIPAGTIAAHDGRGEIRVLIAAETTLEAIIAGSRGINVVVILAED